MPPCVFCGEDGRLTKEHAWPRWAVKLAGRGAPRFTLTSYRWGKQHARWEGPAPDLQVGGFCEACNHDRLAPVEAEARPIMEPLAKGRRRPIWTDEQATIALWAVKTAMVFEFTADANREPFFTLAERRGLASPTDHPTYLGRLAHPIRRASSSALLSRPSTSRHACRRERPLRWIPRDHRHPATGNADLGSPVVPTGSGRDGTTI